MTTTFPSIESAKRYAAVLVGVNPNNVEFIEDPGLKVEDMSALLLDCPDVSEDIKKEVRDRIAAQKGFRFKDREGKDVMIVIGPFRDGFDLWLIDQQSGWAHRV